jgi:hypothetical protein
MGALGVIDDNVNALVIITASPIFDKLREWIELHAEYLPHITMS